MQIVHDRPIATRQWPRLGAALLTLLGSVALLLLLLLTILQVQETYQRIIQRQARLPLYSASFDRSPLYDASITVWLLDR